MKRLALAGALGVIIAGGLALLALVLASASGGAVRADPGTTVGLDTDTTGNTANSLSTRQACLSVSNNQPFGVDVYVKDTPAVRGWEYYLEYDNDLLSITGENPLLFLNFNVGSDVDPYSEAVPDADGYYYGGAFDWSELPGAHENGNGVLDRLTFQASLTHDGVTNLHLSIVDLKDPDGAHIPISDTLDATVGVDTLLPDSDGDGLCDLGDNCPAFPNPGQEDGDGDGVGDACDVCPNISNPGQEDSDHDGDGNVCDNCPTTANPDQSDVDLDTYGDMCDNDADADGFPNTKENVRGSDWLNTYCNNTADDDSDGKVNDGCPTRTKPGESGVHPETGTQCDNALDDDGDGKVNDGCPLVGTRPEASYVEVCDGLDNDSDTAVDEGFPDSDGDGTKDCLEDNVDTDGDTKMNAGTGSDTNDDDDGDADPYWNDGFADTVEAWGGTDSLDNCPENTSDDAWPPDFNNDTVYNSIDFVVFRGVMGTGYGYAGSIGRLYQRRIDLNADGVINVLDSVLPRKYMGTMCH